MTKGAQLSRSLDERRASDGMNSMPVQVARKAVDAMAISWERRVESAVDVTMT